MSQRDDVPVGEVAAHEVISPHERRRLGGRALLGVAAVVAIGLVAALLAWLLIGGSDDESSAVAPTAPSASVPAIASLDDLRTLADSGDTFYWAGVRGGTRIELAVTDGTVFIRYLPPGQPAGTSAPVLTVATYPRANAFEEVSNVAEGENVNTIDLPRGGLAVVDETAGTNVHLAYPDQPYQAEVYSPQVGLARALVENGTIRPFS
jgi:hypothetical protein